MCESTYIRHFGLKTAIRHAGPIGKRIEIHVRESETIESSTHDQERLTGSERQVSIPCRVKDAKQHHDTEGAGRDWLRHSTSSSPRMPDQQTLLPMSTLPGLLPPRKRRSSRLPSCRFSGSQPYRRQLSTPTLPGEIAKKIRTPQNRDGLDTTTGSNFTPSTRLENNRRSAEIHKIRRRKSLRSQNGLIECGDGRWWGPTRPDETFGIRDRATAILIECPPVESPFTFNQSTLASCGALRFAARLSEELLNDQKKLPRSHRAGSNATGSPLTPHHNYPQHPPWFVTKNKVGA